VTRPPEVETSDRDTLRWACRQAIPCAILLPGLQFWGRSIHVDLREGGPRPLLAVAQPVDLVTRRVRPLQAGDTVRAWSVREGRPFHLDGFVEGTCVVEGRGTGPVDAALVQLPFRLLETERRLRPDAASRLRIDVRPLGDRTATPRTLIDRWIEPGRGWRQRGEGHVAELSRRTLSFSLPLRSAITLLPGALVELGVELADLELRTRFAARVSAVMEWDEHLLHGLSLDQPVDGISAEEHRETLRRAAASAG
jgi:hypothetical protein